MAKRAFLIVLDSFGIGEEPDADKFGDVGANTLGSISKSPNFNTPNLKKLGMFNIEGVTCGEKEAAPVGSFARLRERSNGKDTTIGHWEIAGVTSADPLPTYPDGFPREVLDPFEEQTGRKVVCNKPYSGTQVLDDYGEHHMKTGDLIVYTSADSVFQVAAHEDIVPVEELYRYCEIARNILKGKHAVGRVIARPFVGEPGAFKRTSRRHDFSIKPPRKTVLDYIKDSGKECISIGKIFDIFAEQGLTESNRTVSNDDGMDKLMQMQGRDFDGLCFLNLVDFDMAYGHRRNVDAYAQAATDFDGQIAAFMEGMRPDDLLIITADHGCDPAYTKHTDHTREYVPMLAYGPSVKAGVDLGTRYGFCDIAATVAEYLGVKADVEGNSFLSEISK
ncbi:phosphopentomutase [Acetanaerobacterium sp. MSJ-12]|uniref:Phosphopentomutase n=1 Tax=Bittarella massiliensis (ex Durand et al. 2017) TaxID=1720313 RepID=A0AAW5KBP9_9FIRM|nr:MULTISPECIES: phosphopentomutase [Oscillospiraceae]MBC2870799.1 phosphopentomutase [Bittarella massiliensis (ex Durand et al. 2017)]MBU5419252.1 phosphopentomutase [Acetanaerobacterium sp. MSJ-12]MCQ4948775.1 phosphopentomutase [Bittarella massiliensis (ex Durand et al. 2017)]